MINVDIVTPSRKLVENTKAQDVCIPTRKGEIMVLQGHTELLTILDTGALVLHQDGGQRKFAVSYGFAEIRNDKVLILAETCEESTEIDVERAKAAQKRAEDALTGSLTEDRFKKYQLKLQRAIIRQHISQ
ncbi:MAG: ATP synthase F1 subunit epsilon [Deltaproteobacteria bacterium]|nr:ATP synthase F1 subunit epsilon [Deltaproteobacteria bacterium]